MRRRCSWQLVAAAAAILAQLPAAAAADAAAPTAADINRLEAELARVQQQLREQHELIMQLMQMHEALLKYISSGGHAAGAPLPSLPAPGTARASSSAAEPTSRGVANAPNAGPSTATVTGHVHGAVGEAYVFLDGMRQVASHPATIEIKQDHKQFVPAVAVVPIGARVVFPNADTISHNVFSITPGDAFDLGMVKGGQTPTPVVLLKPGHVEVYCNIHSGMRADVLVVPNGHWSRVRPDGSFSLPGIPLGARRIVLWGPRIKPASQQLEVLSAGAAATFSAEARTTTPHLNKTGGAYGSYEN